MAMINDASGTLSQNDTLFLRFLSPATGVFDHLTLMSGGNNTDVQLEVGLFIRGDSGNWHLVEESNVITFSDPTEDAYRRITGSGLNALLEQHASYKIGIRNLSTTPWSYSSFTPTGNLPGTSNNGARMCALRATAELDSYRDGTTVNIDDMSHGHGKRPWFRVSQ